MLFKNYDWKKQATQVLQDEQVEKAFMDQAYGFIQNKAGKLMETPHKLGFEIVHKNDANTRMVGIFAFRIQDDLLYVPVFFLNGEIKGTDLLYRHATKTFVPLNEDWVSFMFEKAEEQPGEGIDRAITKRTPGDIEMRRIAYPPDSYYSRKNASEKDPREEKVEPTCKCTKDQQDCGKTGCPGQKKDNPGHGYKSAADWISYWSEQTKPDPVLREFMEEIGTTDMLDKIASWCEESYLFANALHMNCAPGDYMPKGMETRIQGAAMEKKAADEAAKPKALLILHTEMHPGIKEASEEFYKNGYKMEDNRDEGKLTFIYEDDKSFASTITEPGIYDVILKDGSTESCLCAPLNDQQIQCSDGLESVVEGNLTQSNSQFQDSHNPEVVAIKLSDRKAGVGRGAVGHMTEMLNQALGDEDLIDKQMATGTTYRILDLNGFTLSKPIHVVDTEVRDGLIIYKIIQKWGGRPTTLMYNPNFVHTDYANGVIGPGAVFVRVKAPKPKKEGSDDYYDWNAEDDDSKLCLGNQQNLDNWIFGHSRPFGVIKKSSDEFQFRYRHLKYSDTMSKIAALVHLTKDLQISAPDAEVMLEKTADWHLGVQNAVKRASVIRIIDTEDFQPSFNQDFGVTEDRPHFQALETEYDFDEVPLHRIGDAHDPGSGEGPDQSSSKHPGEGLPKHVLMSSSPEQLAQMSQNTPQVFEHGVVGSLATTFDSMAMIDKYIPKLEEALDSIGRMLFLYYWKPGDFQDSYGADDMVNLENEFLSNFKSLGDMTLNLMKKNKNRQGTVPLHS